MLLGFFVCSRWFDKPTLTWRFRIKNSKLGMTTSKWAGRPTSICEITGITLSGFNFPFQNKLFCLYCVFAILVRFEPPTWWRFHLKTWEKQFFPSEVIELTGEETASVLSLRLMGFLFTRWHHTPGLWSNQQGLTLFFRVGQVCLGGLVMGGRRFFRHMCFTQALKSCSLSSVQRRAWSRSSSSYTLWFGICSKVLKV